MRLILGLLILTTTLSCSPTKKNQNEFKNIVFEGTVSSNELRPVDSVSLKKWDHWTRYRRYYNYADLGGEFQLKVIKATGDDYSVLMLLTFDKSGNKIDEYVIAGVDCGGPTELEDKIEFCPYLKSIMISDSEFIVREIHQFSTDTVNWKPTERDSIEWKIFIDDKGKIKKRTE